MNFQISAAQTPLIAIGMNKIDLARDSYLTRSARTATARPTTIVPNVRNTTHRMLLTSEASPGPLRNQE